MRTVTTLSTLFVLSTLATGCARGLDAYELDPTDPDAGFVADAPADDTDTVDTEDDTVDPIDTADTVDTETPEDTAADAFVGAAPDFDLPADPLFFHRFTPYGTADRTFTVTDDVSDPTGDREDWIGFRTLAGEQEITTVRVTLTCVGDATDLRVEVWDDGPVSPVRTTTMVRCGDDRKPLSLQTNHDYLLRVFFPYPDGSEVYVAYDLTATN